MKRRKEAAMSQELVSLYESQDLPEAELLHQRLADAGIESFVEPTASPFDGLTAANQGTHVRVRSSDLSPARRILQEFLGEQAD
jgi:hypothetical protein